VPVSRKIEQYKDSEPAIGLTLVQLQLGYAGATASAFGVFLILVLCEIKKALVSMNTEIS
jgi:hypothetical protein